MLITATAAKAAGAAAIDFVLGNPWRAACLIALAAFLYQTARIEGVLWFDGLADRVEACAAADREAKAGVALGRRSAERNDKQRQEGLAADRAAVEEARKNAETDDPEGARAAAGGGVNAVADELRRQQQDPRP